MFRHIELNQAKLFRLMKRSTVVLAGNRKLKIYGRLHCKSGKRMKRENRVFFVNEPEALAQGYRPCGHCMRTAYKIWKEAKVEN
ncbi:MAG: Ada metal-binding domain-containing protein [Bacteroidota bacterium]